MTITRTEIDDVEFFVSTQTGEVGISISGLARLCGVQQSTITRLLQKLEALMHKTSPKGAEIHTGQGVAPMHKTRKSKSLGGRPELSAEDLADCLRALTDYALYLDVGNEYKNASILSERACIAIITYYAYEARQTRQRSSPSVSSRQLFGLRGWIHSITGWEAPKPKHHAPLTHAEKLGIDPRYKAVTLDRHVIYNALLNKGINAQMYRVYLYLMDCELMQTRPSPSDICQHANVSKHSLYNLVERMRAYTLVPDWLVLDPSSRSLEAQIRDKLHHRLGGEVEVQTIHGPIDLLTATQIIEIKRIEDWKTGFGQVLAKAPAYPKHDKRLHLFGNSDRSFRNIKACCQEFAISVSFEKASLELV